MAQNWKDTSLTPEERTKLLVDQMTLEEKVSQMTYYSSALSRFGIPEYNWWNECLHGVGRAGAATMFPQPIGMASAFDREALREVAQIIGKEARIKHYAASDMEDHGIYKGLTMWTPNINIFRDPRWGRGHETYGEDPYLTSVLGVSFIKGLQGEGDYYTCVATAKHFAVHSGPENDRHVFDAKPEARDLTLTYLPAFKAAVDEGNVQSVMGAYNRVYGEAACASTLLLCKKLRGEWGFDGYVVSDCGAIEDFYENHKVVATPAEAAALAVSNGCDLCCGRVFPHLLEAVKQGLITEETITRSAYRLLLARMKLGMFDPREGQPYADTPYTENDSAESHEKSLRMAEKSLVLLKNNGKLPFDKDSLKTVAVIGPNADSRDALKGNYCGTPTETWTVLEGLRRVVPNIRFIAAEGCNLTGGSAEEGWGESDTYRVAEALQAIKVSDAVIVVTGLNGDREGEEGYGSGDRETMLLPSSQRMLLDCLTNVDKPMVLVNMTGSATVFPHEEAFDAIMQAWYPGQMGGIAIAEVLFGMVSPSGRLPVTFYKDMDQVPDFKNYSMKGRTYRYLAEKPAYPFGFGLSYTEFAYSDLKVERKDNALFASVKVTNVGSKAGREVTQFYTRIEKAEYDSPIFQLSGFEPVELAKGESTVVTAEIPADHLCVCDDEGKLLPHKGSFTIFAGGGQPDERTQELTGKKPLQVTVVL